MKTKFAAKAIERIFLIGRIHPSTEGHDHNRKGTAGKKTGGDVRAKEGGSESFKGG